MNHLPSPAGVVLRRIRQRLKISARAMAEMCCFSQPFLSNVENGVKSPPRGFADRVSIACGLTDNEREALVKACQMSTEVFKREEDNPLLREVRFKLSRNLHRMSNDVLAKISDIIKNPEDD
jgi:transcriptional regulator with XRE-family HTH domain